MNRHNMILTQHAGSRSADSPRAGDPAEKRVSDVRPFASSDIAEVADLHRRVNGVRDDVAPSLAESYRKFFVDVFLQPGQADGVGSLVYEEKGSIIGFQGIHSRRMIFEDQPVVMAISSHFVVDPARRGLPALRLLKKAMDGPQDLTLADESNDVSRRLWEWCGGTTTLLYSMHWVRPLRLTESAVTLLLRKRSARAAFFARPVARVIDGLTTRLALDPLGITSPEGSRETLDEATVVAHLAEFTAECAFRPDYGAGLLPWILERARTRSAGGEFRQVQVRDRNQEIAGWYIYFANRGGLGEVLQIAAKKDTAGMVLDHLIEDAHDSGVVALAGRLEPAFAHEMSQRHCMFYRRGNWMLIHSKHPKLLHAIERGDAFLSRLEGEWCLRFQ